MLALSRKIGERIFIGDNVILTIVDIRGDSVRVAIDAPREIKIFRGEIYEAIAAENKTAAAQTQTDLTSLKNLPGPEKKEKSFTMARKEKN